MLVHEFGWVDWKGVRVLKTPDALMLQQELIHETQPEVIVETGTKFGGSACFYADLHVEVVSIDVACPKPPTPHFLVTYLTGYSTSPQVLFDVDRLTRGKRTMVVLDSDHSYENVLAELDVYSGYVSEGCYLVVEDLDQGGPRQALAEWLPDHPEFERLDFGWAAEHGYLWRCS
jgi:cephalosporin hydroxylase